MNKEEFLQLIERVVSGLASDEDLKEYNRLFNSFQSSDEQWEARILGDKDEIVDDIHKGILQKLKDKNQL